MTLLKILDDTPEDWPISEGAMNKRLQLWLVVLLSGIAVQALGLALFCSLSTAKWPLAGRAFALAVTLAGVVTVAWFTLRNHNKPRTIVPVGLILAFGYLAAFHFVGLAAFPGLLRDVDAQGYWTSIVRVFAATALTYMALAAAVFGAISLTRTSSATNQQNSSAVLIRL